MILSVINVLLTKRKWERKHSNALPWKARIAISIMMNEHDIKPKYRLRKNHKPIYAILFLLETGKFKDPIPSTRLAELIEKTCLTDELRRKDYNRTCRTLVSHGMLERYYNSQTRRVAFKLTEKSLKIAPDCFFDVFGTDISSFMKRK